MTTGHLRHLVVIDEPVPTQNETGEEVLAWTPFRKAFAAIEPLRGRELASFAGIQATTDTRIRVRWNPGLERVSPKWRIRHSVMGRERVYNIQSIADVDTRHREVEILCQSGINDG